MKIYGNSPKIYQNTQINNTTRSAESREQTGQADQTRNIQKLNIPKNFEPKLTLNKEEQNFFEDLYPKARKEIRRYLQNQTDIQVEKGKIIDMRG